MYNYLVTAIITTYNRQWKYLKRALMSIKTQTYANIEIIVVDDNCNDSKCSEIIKEKIIEFDNSIRYIKQNGNQGACAARNLGLCNANGYFIAYLDDDDEWLPNKIEEQVNAYTKYNNKEIALVSCDGYKIEEDGRRRSVRPYNFFGQRNIPEYITLKHLLGGDYIGTTSQPLIVKNAIKSVGGFNEKLPARQDYEMWLRIAEKYSIVSIKGYYFNHYIHSEQQISKSSAKALIGYLNIYIEFRSYYHSSPANRKKILCKIKENLFKLE